MAFVNTSAYCPTQRSYTMSLSNAAYQTSIGGGVSGYQSLYSEQRRDLDVPEVRMETFIFYPQSSISTADIAAAGFYYTGEGHVVRCFCCKLTVSRLNDGDDPFTVHRSQAPNCPFVRKTVAQGEVPVERRGEDMVDGGSDSALPGDVEVDGALEDDVVPRGLSKRDVRRTTTTAVKPLRRAAPINKSELRRENEQLRSEITCRKCKQTRVQTLFLPCRHLVACEDCANSMDDCIACSEKILGTVRTFLI